MTKYPHNKDSSSKYSNLNDDSDKKKNFNQDNNLDDYYFEAKRRIIRAQNENKQHKRFERAKKFAERRKKFAQFFNNSFSQISKIFNLQLMQGILSIVAAFTIMRQTKELENKFDEQQRQIAQIERNLEQGLTKKDSFQNLWEKHWPRIVLGGGSILLPAGKYAYSNWQTQRQLSHTQGQLDQTKGQLYETKGQLDKTRDILLETEDILEQVKEQSEADMKHVKEQHQIQISKLHVTLNRFNDAAMQSAKQETDMRQKILECKDQLAEAIELRDSLQQKIKDCYKQNDEKDAQLQDLQLDLQILKTRVADQEVEQARLVTDLQKVEKDKLFWNRQSTKLKKQINKADAKRRQLYNDLASKNKHIQDLELERDKIHSERREQLKKQIQLEKESENLRRQNEKYEVSLQKAIDDTNHYALKMDQANERIHQYQETHLNDQQKMQVLNEQVNQQNKLINQKKRDIIEIDQANKEYENTIRHLKNELSHNIIMTDQLNSELTQAQANLEKASAENKEQLIQEIDSKKELRKKFEKDYSKLKNTLNQKSRALAQSYLKQEEFIQNIKDLENKLKLKDKSFFSLLQSEREAQEQKFNSAIDSNHQIINDLLNQQEADQHKSWWQKLKIQIVPQVSISNDQTKQPTELEKDSYFYSSWSTEIPGMPKIKERYSVEKQEWEVVEPKIESKKEQISNFLKHIRFKKD